jgi:hypothetical protein
MVDGLNPPPVATSPLGSTKSPSAGLLPPCPLYLHHPGALPRKPASGPETVLGDGAMVLPAPYL